MPASAPETAQTRFSPSGVERMTQGAPVGDAAAAYDQPGYPGTGVGGAAPVICGPIPWSSKTPAAYVTPAAASAAIAMAIASGALRLSRDSSRVAPELALWTC